jgi:hypothetical protein
MEKATPLLSVHLSRVNGYGARRPHTQTWQHLQCDKDYTLSVNKHVSVMVAGTQLLCRSEPRIEFCVFLAQHRKDARMTRRARLPRKRLSRLEVVPEEEAQTHVHLTPV